MTRWHWEHFQSVQKHELIFKKVIMKLSKVVTKDFSSEQKD